MTIDERLEALTQSLELMAAMQKDSEARWEAQISDLRESVKDAAETAKQASENVNRISEAVLVTSVRQNIQENEIQEHKQRLDAMEQLCYRTERNLAEATEKLNALIAIVDGIVRDRKGSDQP